MGLHQVRAQSFVELDSPHFLCRDSKDGARSARSRQKWSQPTGPTASISLARRTCINDASRPSARWMTAAFDRVTPFSPSSQKPDTMQARASRASPEAPGSWSPLKTGLVRSHRRTTPSRPMPVKSFCPILERVYPSSFAGVSSMGADPGLYRSTLVRCKRARDTSGSSSSTLSDSTFVWIDRSANFGVDVSTWTTQDVCLMNAPASELNFSLAP